MDSSQAQCYTDSINERQFSSGLFFLALFLRGHNVIVSWRKERERWRQRLIHVSIGRLATHPLHAVACFRAEATARKGNWEMEARAALGEFDPLEPQPRSWFSCVFRSYINWNKGTPSLSRYQAHGVQTSPIQF